jgi:hypothetical protein
MQELRKMAATTAYHAQREPIPLAMGHHAILAVQANMLPKCLIFLLSIHGLPVQRRIARMSCWWILFIT